MDVRASTPTDGEAKPRASVSAVTESADLRFSREDKSGRLRVVASPTGQDGSVSIHSEATLHAGVFEPGQAARLELAPGRHAWVHVARGSALISCSGWTMRSK